VILVDTSVWVDHIGSGDEDLADLLEAVAVLVHPFVIGELALGSFKRRNLVLAALQELPRPEVATDKEVLRVIDRYSLFGKGIGYVDTHLLAATLLTPGASLWTRDRRLFSAADQLNLAYQN
jgi:predicted nucleic acid-binding protein